MEGKKTGQIKIIILRIKWGMKQNTMDGREMDKIGKQRQVMWLQKISTVMIYIFFFFTTMLSIQETDNLPIWQIHSFEVFRNIKPKPLIIVLIQISTNKSIDPRAGISTH